MHERGQQQLFWLVILVKFLIEGGLHERGHQQLVLCDMNWFYVVYLRTHDFIWGSQKTRDGSEKCIKRCKSILYIVFCTCIFFYIYSTCLRWSSSSSTFIWSTFAWRYIGVQNICKRIRNFRKKMHRSWKYLELFNDCSFLDIRKIL